MIDAVFGDSDMQVFNKPPNPGISHPRRNDTADFEMAESSRIRCLSRIRIPARRAVPPDRCRP